MLSFCCICKQTTLAQTYILVLGPGRQDKKDSKREDKTAREHGEREERERERGERRERRRGTEREREVERERESVEPNLNPDRNPRTIVS